MIKVIIIRYFVFILNSYFSIIHYKNQIKIKNSCLNRIKGIAPKFNREDLYISTFLFLYFERIYLFE